MSSEQLQQTAGDGGKQGSTDTSPVATFISKVWKIVEKPEHKSLISWTDVSHGRSRYVDAMVKYRHRYVRVQCVLVIARPWS